MVIAVGADIAVFVRQPSLPVFWKEPHVLSVGIVPTKCEVALHDLGHQVEHVNVFEEVFFEVVGHISREFSVQGQKVRSPTLTTRYAMTPASCNDARVSSIARCSLLVLRRSPKPHLSRRSKYSSICLSWNMAVIFAPCSIFSFFRPLPARMINGSVTSSAFPPPKTIFSASSRCL